MIERLLAPEECRSLAALYSRDTLFRSRVVMDRHGFGRGEYKYFSYPLPDLVAELRAAMYPRLAPVANRWNVEMGIAVRYPERHEDFWTVVTPLIRPDLRRCCCNMEPGTTTVSTRICMANMCSLCRWHFSLSEPGKDFEGGEFVTTEQRPRMQSRPIVVPLRQGDAVVFAVHHRPVRGTRGVYRVNLRHGVSRVRSGSRHTMGVIFHDAK